MGLTGDRQKEVLACFNGDKELQLSKKEIIEKARLYYYHNTDKHAGDVLSRMVNSGLLRRISKGVYSLGSGVKRKDKIVPANQIKLL